jgi:hypothetical protein
MEILFEALVGMGQLVLIMAVSALVVAFGFLVKQAIFKK